MNNEKSGTAIVRGKKPRSVLRVGGVTSDPDDLLPHMGTTDEEVADDVKWQEKFNASGRILSHLAKEAREERRRGETLPLETIFEE